MAILLRLMGAFWILFSIRPVLFFFRTALSSGLNVHPRLSLLENVLLLAGGIGLLLLKEWGRWLLIIALAVILIETVGPALLALRFSAYLLRPLLLYGIFLALLWIPQARAATQK